MRNLRFKKISKSKYEVTLEVSDKDIDRFEQLALFTTPFKKLEIHENIMSKMKKSKYDFDVDMKMREKIGDDVEFTEEFERWLLKTWRCFGKVYH
jgi:hypothetical protein